MDDIALIFAKLAGLQKAITTRLKSLEKLIDGAPVEGLTPYYVQYDLLASQLKSALPDLYSDLPQLWRDTEYVGSLRNLSTLLDYIFEVRANSRIGKIIEEVTEVPHKVFISHGKSQDWRAVQDYIEKDLHIETLELAQEPNRGRTVLQKLWEESVKCNYAVVVMTADDEVSSGPPRARENVMHEIGFFQGKYGLENVCLLYEEGTSIPSNIHGLVYIPFPKGYIEATFGALQRDLRVAFPNRS